MCVERYLAVVHPVTFLKYKPLRYRVICCTVVWIIGLGSCLSCTFTIVLCNFYIYVCCYSLQYFLFLFIQLFCLVAVLRALKQSGPGERGSQREEENHIKRRSFYLILIITVSMAIIYCMFHYFISGLYFILTQRYFQEPFTVAFLYTYIYWLVLFSLFFIWTASENSPVVNKKCFFFFFLYYCYILVFYILQFSDAALVASDLYLQCEVAQVMFVWLSAL